MTLLQAVILGVVQGITEFLPISSSGHLVLIEQWWHITNGGLLFITFLHLGTLIAVVWALRTEVIWLLAHPFSRTSRMLVLALIPTIIAGIAFEDLFTSIFQSGVTLGLEFVITGVVLWAMDTMPAQVKQEEELTPTDALWIGTFQGFAIMPALSRSGLTILGGLWRGMQRESAARFSFLLSIPTILGATLFQIDDMLHIHQTSLSGNEMTLFVVGMVSAAVMGYLSIRATFWLLSRARMRIFAVYAWMVAALILANQLHIYRWL